MTAKNAREKNHIPCLLYTSTGLLGQIQQAHQGTAVGKEIVNDQHMVFRGEEDHVLIIDDFLANGCALMGLLDLAKEEMCIRDRLYSSNSSSQ